MIKVTEPEIIENLGGWKFELEDIDGIYVGLKFVNILKVKYEYENLENYEDAGIVTTYTVAIISIPELAKWSDGLNHVLDIITSDLTDKEGTIDKIETTSTFETQEAATDFAKMFYPEIDLVDLEGLIKVKYAK